MVERIATPQWSWAAKINPDGSASFAHLKIKTPLLSPRQFKPKSERIRERRLLDQRRAQAVEAACKGPCLTWSQREGWGVTTSMAPARSDLKLHTLRGAFKERPKFWLFPSEDGYAARLACFSLQVTAQSPREAVSALRTAFIQYGKMYPTGSLGAVDQKPSSV